MKVCSLLPILYIINLINAHTFNCIFDQINRDLLAQAENNIPEVPVVKPGKYMNGRLLTSTSTSSYGSLRIQLQYSQFTSSTITPGVNGASTTTTARLNFILNALFVTEQFYQKRLRAGQLSFVTIPSYCVDFAPSNIGGTIANTQLLIFAQYLTDKNKAYGATGKSCDWVSGSLPDYTLQVGRPSVGRIIFNTYNLVDQEASLTNRLFQSITTTAIHEVTHILGFDSTLYSKYLNPSTGNYYSSPTASASVHSSRPATIVLQTPYVKAWARDHYGCQTLPGMLLQNQEGTTGSHWQRTAIYDEIMTATSFGASKGIFGITYALLKDTGWYQVDDKFSQTTNYGYKKGCSFVLDACYSSTSFPEFCNAASLTGVSSCQTTFYGKAQCLNDASILADSCGIYFPNFNCVDSASINTGYQSYTYEAFGTNSFCIKSNLGTVTIQSTLQSRCYPYVCNPSSIVFTIGSYSITCLSTEQGVTKTLTALTGSLTCPIFSQFCTVSRKTCANWCSQHGYCSDGICNCKSGYKGSDCSVSICLSTQYYSVVTSTCVSSCPSGTYLNIYSNTCQYCKSPCDQCTGTPTNCVSCASSSILKYNYLNVCYSSCPSSTYNSNFNCTSCDTTTANCLTCSGNATYCTSCQPGTYLNQGTCVATCTPPYQVTDTVNKQCVSSCPSYLLSTSSTCVYCSNNTYYYQGSCYANCSFSSSSVYYPDDTYHACLQCSSSCLTCDGPYPQNCTSCKSTSGNPYWLLKMCWSICPKGYFANVTSGNCQSCPSSLKCQSCKYNTTSSLPYCTSCIYGTFYLSSTSTCSTSCNTNQYKNTWNNSCNDCNSACSTCNGPSSYSCLSCPGVNNILTNITGGYCLVSCPTTGYVQVGTTCQICDNTCLTCNGISASQCATCQNGYYLNNGYCRYVCPSETYPNSTTRQCLPCDSSCSYCFDGTIQGCTSCSGTKYLYNFTCISNCPNGLQPNQWNVCYQFIYSASILVFASIFVIF